MGRGNNARVSAAPGSVFAPDSAAGPILLFGHRGYSALAPENTLAAFRTALERDIPGVELDVQLTADGKLVVMHDFNLKRITGHEADLDQCTASQIRRLDAGSWFSPAFTGEKIPFLDEVFDLLGRRAYYDVELKWQARRGGGLEERVLETIRAHGLEDRCLVSSFNPFCIRRVRRLAPGLPTAHIYCRHRSVHPLLRHGEALLAIPTPFAKPEHVQVRGISSFVARRILRSQIISWTVDDPQEATRLVRLGVRGIISNHPGRIRSALPG
jgi:glycerophosphoryl diester phosphodiesterase